jgi:hypothetical protein
LLPVVAGDLAVAVAVVEARGRVQGRVLPDEAALTIPT